MAVKDPVKVKGAQIVTPVQAVSFASGLDERGDYNIPPDAISYGRNVSVNSSNNVTKRLGKRKWLPNTVGFNGEVSTVYYNDQIYYFVADDGKIRYCQENDTAWTDCGGSNTITTTAGVITTFMRSNDMLFAMYGVDNLRFVDLSTLDVVVYSLVADPSSALTATATGISTTGTFYVYYATTYNTDAGTETGISPILARTVSKSRSTWLSDGTEYLTIAFNDTPPSGAVSRNLYGAVTLNGTTAVYSDLVRMASNIPIIETTFIDNGTIPFNINFGFPPSTNATEGIKASLATMVDKTPVFYSDPDNPYDLLFALVTEEGVNFGGSETQRLPLLKGTNYYPTSVIGFRNNQNIPSLLTLFSSTQGTSKQQIITKKTVTYGNEVLSYWDPEELNAGASAVYAKHGVINYLGKLLFPSSEGITAIQTEQNLQNVLSPSIISEAISQTFSTIKNANFDKIIGASWNNLVCYSVPSRGFNYNNQVLVYDLSNKDKPKWYIWDLEVDWIGTISPPNKDSFLYIRQGNEFFKLVEGYVAEDENSDGTSSPFPVVVEGALQAANAGKNTFFAATQAVVYLANFIGTVDITISYVDKKGKVKSKTKQFTNGASARNLTGGWGNPRLLWSSWNNRMINWSTPIPTSSDSNNSLKINKRCRIRLPNRVVNEAKFRVSSDLEGTSFDVVSVVIEGVNIGVIGDIV
jgi:hypothetical protein